MFGYSLVKTAKLTDLETRVRYLEVLVSDYDDQKGIIKEIRDNIWPFFQAGAARNSTYKNYLDTVVPPA